MSEEDEGVGGLGDRYDAGAHDDEEDRKARVRARNRVSRGQDGPG